MHFSQNVKSLPPNPKGFATLFDHGNVMPWINIGNIDVAVMFGEEIFLCHVNKIALSWGHSGSLTTVALQCAPPYDGQVVVIGFGSASEYWKALSAIVRLLKSTPDLADSLSVASAVFGGLLEDGEAFSVFEKSNDVVPPFELVIHTSLKPFRSVYSETKYSAAAILQAMKDGKDSILIDSENANVIPPAIDPLILQSEEKGGES